ncbi:hypothetical protein ACKC9G_12460 [Pokkaliibacter sp. CJK22405]|uniref:hypothetical protein n=1 Tax=Pokkaliibacter sp. CJK22405 TaxID=3384615 RepID=UPI003984F70A
MTVRTVREGIIHYRETAHSGANNAACTKPNAQYRRINEATETTMGRLQLSSAVGKTIDSLCVKGNQLDDVYETHGEAKYRVSMLRRHKLSSNQHAHGLFAGYCGEMSGFAERILAAVMSDRRHANRKEGQSFETPPITLASWEGDHAFAMLGDPRKDKQTTVVPVDGWVMRPAAHTLNNSAFTGTLKVYSSTRQVPGRYLDKVVQEWSLDEVEKKYERSGKARSTKQRDKYYDALKKDVSRGRMKIWDHQWSDQSRSTVQYYQAPGGEAISYDYLPKDELELKIEQHRDARNSGLSRTLDQYLGRSGRRQVEEERAIVSGDDDSSGEEISRPTLPEATDSESDGEAAGAASVTSPTLLSRQPTGSLEESTRRLALPEDTDSDEVYDTDDDRDADAGRDHED